MLATRSGTNTRNPQAALSPRPIPILSSISIGTPTPHYRDRVHSRLLKDAFCPGRSKGSRCKAANDAPGTHRRWVQAYLVRTPQHCASARGTRPEDGSPQMGLFQRPVTRHSRTHANRNWSMIRPSFVTLLRRRPSKTYPAFSRMRAEAGFHSKTVA